MHQNTQITKITYLINMLIKTS